MIIMYEYWIHNMPTNLYTRNTEWCLRMVWLYRRSAHFIRTAAILSSCTYYTYFANYYYLHYVVMWHVYLPTSILTDFDFVSYKRNVGRSTLRVANKNGFSYRRAVPEGKVFSASTTCWVDASRTSKYDCNLIYFKSRIISVDTNVECNILTVSNESHGTPTNNLNMLFLTKETNGLEIVIFHPVPWFFIKCVLFINRM